MSKDDRAYKDFALKAAKELHYSDETISRIQKSESASEIERIMIDQRKSFR